MNMVKSSTATHIHQGSVPVQVLEPSRERVFNLVPGFEAVPFALQGKGTKAIEYAESGERISWAIGGPDQNKIRAT